MSVKDYNCIQAKLKLNGNECLLDEFYEIDKNFTKNEIYYLKSRQDDYKVSY